MRLLPLVSLLISFSAFAGPIEDGQQKFDALLQQYDAAITPVKEKLELKWTQVQQEIQAKQSAKDACTNFDCADRLAQELAVLKTYLKESFDDGNMELATVEAPFDLKAREILVEAFAREFVVRLQQDTGFRHVTLTKLTSCGNYVDATGTFSPGKAQACAQADLEFSYQGQFFKVSKAFGIGARYRQIDGSLSVNLGDVPYGLGEVAELFKDPNLFFYQDHRRILFSADNFLRRTVYEFSKTNELGYATLTYDVR